MLRSRSWMIALHLCLASVVLLGLTWSSLEAAPGPLRSDPVATVSDEYDATDDVPTPVGTTSDAADQDQARLDYRAPVDNGQWSGGATTSYRPAAAGRSSAGSTAPIDVDREQPLSVPEIDQEAEPVTPPDITGMAEAPYQIVESGRPQNSGDSSLAYDGDPATSWTVGSVAPMAYAWFDLGTERPVSAVRWLQTVADGPIAVQISRDRETWETVLVWEQPSATDWQAAEIDAIARYVRFVVGTSEGSGVDANLAEVEIYGPPGAGVPDTAIVEASQRASSTVGQQAPSTGEPRVVIISDETRQSRPASDVVIVTPVPDSEAVEITINGAVSECRGGDRCVVESQPPEVIEDCGDGTTHCVIHVNVGAGVAVCDVSGGSDGGAGRGRGNGRTCTADASGGTVEISDINR